MKILITGGSGFFGSALARQLHAEGHQLALLLRPHSSLARLGDIARQVQIGRFGSDVDIVAFVQAVRPDAVVHTACSYGRQGETLMQLFDANLRFGLQVLQAMPSPAGMRGLFLNIGTALAPAVSAYALSKTQFAQWGGLMAQAGGARFVQVLLQHLYGPGDDPVKFTSQVMRACRSHQPTLALTAGQQRRDFIHVDDAVSACALLLREAASWGETELFELGTGLAPTVREFVETVHRLTSSTTQLQFGALPYRPQEAMHCQADIGRLRGLGWAPRHNLRSGLQHTLEMDIAR